MKYSIFAFIAGILLTLAAQSGKSINYYELGKKQSFMQGYYKNCFGHLESGKIAKPLLYKVNLIVKAAPGAVIDILDLQCRYYGPSETIDAALSEDVQELAALDKVFYTNFIKRVVKEEDEKNREGSRK